MPMTRPRSGGVRARHWSGQFLMLPCEYRVAP